MSSSNELAECKKKLSKAMEAIELADSIMAYAAGDAWERECTKEDRDKFRKLYEELNNKVGEA